MFTPSSSTLPDKQTRQSYNMRFNELIIRPNLCGLILSLFSLPCDQLFHGLKRCASVMQKINVYKGITQSSVLVLEKPTLVRIFVANLQLKISFSHLLLLPPRTPSLFPPPPHLFLKFVYLSLFLLLCDIRLASICSVTT